ncbi:MAG: YraN family protein [Verrucomicrobiota bacterium]
MRCFNWVRPLLTRWLDSRLDSPLSLLDRDDFESSGEWNEYIGEIGEALAEKHCWRTRRVPLYRNFRAPGGGELDLVAREDDVLIFCEVKTRTSERFGRPSKAVDQEKQRLIAKGANAWLRELGHPDIIYRFDIIEVLLTSGEVPEINHIKGAFNT